MYILKKIKAWTKENGRPPWRIGVDLNKASDEVKFASQLISEEELCAISKFCRLKGYREQLIQEIKKRHFLPLELLAELTGLSISTIKHINCKKKHKK